MAGILEAGQVTEFGYEGQRDGELDAAHGLQGLGHRLQSPGLHLVLQFLFQTLEAFGMLIDRADIFLEDDLLHGGGTDHFGEPPQMGRTPGGPARIPNILPEQERFETKLRSL